MSAPKARLIALIVGLVLVELVVAASILRSRPESPSPQPEPPYRHTVIDPVPTRPMPVPPPARPSAPTAPTRVSPPGVRKPSNFVFLFDVSRGAWSDEQVESLRSDVHRRLITVLAVSDASFNIIVVSDAIYTFAPTPQKATPENTGRARRFLDRTTAAERRGKNRGAALPDALKRALSSPTPLSGIVLLTGDAPDGATGDRLLEVARKYNRPGKDGRRTRIHVVMAEDRHAPPEPPDLWTRLTRDNDGALLDADWPSGLHPRRRYPH